MQQTERITTWLQSLVDAYKDTNVGTIELGDMNGYGEGLTASLDLIDGSTEHAGNEPLAYPLLSLDIFADDSEQIAATLQIGWWDDEEGLTDAVPLLVRSETTLVELIRWLSEHSDDFDVTHERLLIATNALPDFLRLAQHALKGV